MFSKNLDGPAFEKCIKMLAGQDVHIKNSPTSEQGGRPKISQGTQKSTISRFLNKECLQNANLFYIFKFNRSTIDYI